MPFQIACGACGRVQQDRLGGTGCERCRGALELTLGTAAPPFAAPERVTLGEGNTPRIRLPRWGAEIGAPLAEKLPRPLICGNPLTMAPVRPS